MCAQGWQERTVGVGRGNTGQVVCHVNAHPSENLIFSWTRLLKDGREEPISFLHPRQVFSEQNQEGLLSSFQFTPQKMTDYVSVACRATNTVGTMKHPCIVHLVAAGPPDLPTNCSSTPEPMEGEQVPAIMDVTVVCLEGFNGGFPQKFRLEAWQSDNILANISR